MQRDKSAVQIDATSRPLSKFSECANLTKTGAGQHQVLMQESNAKEGRSAAPGEANPTRVGFGHGRKAGGLELLASLSRPF